MPQNSTALDFAFSLHTDIGSHCIGAKVNHKLVPLSHKLQSGDQVEILTSKSQRVQPQWEVFATTARARDVLGYVDENDRIIIHKRQCPVAAKLKSSYGNRILATEWDTHKELSFLVYIYIKGIDSMGLLNEVTQVISRQLNVNIRKLTIETNDGIFEGKIQLWVHDVEDVKTICNNLKKIQNIKQVNRVEE